jgi:DNA-binding XRE family transcriptional regulator
MGEETPSEGCRPQALSSTPLEHRRDLRQFGGVGVNRVEVLNAAPDRPMAGFGEHFGIPQLAHVVGDVRQRVLQFLGHHLRRDRLNLVCSEPQDATAELMAQGLLDRFLLLPELLHSEPFPRPVSVRNWLSMRLTPYRSGSIEWREQIITRVFAAAIRLGNRNDPLVSDVTRVAAVFGQRLAQLRTDKNFSQEQLADLAAVHRTAISNLEKGAHLPRLDTILKLAGALEIEPCQMIQGLPDWTPPSTSPGGFGK